MHIPASKVPGFKAGKGLKDKERFTSKPFNLKGFCTFFLSFAH